MAILNAEDILTIKETQKLTRMVDIDDEKYLMVTIKFKEGKYVITGQAYNKSPKKKNKYQKQCTAINIEAVDMLVATMARGVAEAKNGKKNGTKHCKGSVGDFADRVMRQKIIFDPKTWGVRKGGKYLAYSTVRNAVTYFAYTIGSIYNECGSLDVSEELMQEYKNREINRVIAQQNKKTKGVATRENKANAINDRWRYGEEARKLLIQIAPDDGPWPSNPLPVDERITCSTPDLLKIITFERLIKAATVVYRACELHCQEAFASCGEVFTGARVGESAAMRVGLFEFRGELCRYYIDEQINMNRELTYELKNEYSHRFVHVYGPFRKLIEMKKEQLKEAGVLEEDYNKAFLGSCYDDPFAPLRKSSVSAFMREVLELVGCTSEEVNLLQRIAESDTGTDSDNDLSAHVFRRTFATLAINGGIPENEVDALLGHENKRNIHKGFSGWDFAEKIVGKLNRCFVYGDLGETINPAYRPVMLNNNFLHLQGNRKHIFNAECDGYFSCSVETKEPDDLMIINVNNPEIKMPLHIDEKIDCMETMKNKEILCKLPSMGEINHWIEETMNLDISKLIKRRRDNGTDTEYDEELGTDNKI